MPSSPTVSNLILGLLSEHHLATAPALLDFLHQQRPGINKTTVYRALETLLTDGKICRQHLTDNHIVYELRDHHHDHIVCTKCGTVDTVACQLHTTEVNGFLVEHHHVALYGICPTCQEKSS